jgi:hypothetical protein
LIFAQTLCLVNEIAQCLPDATPADVDDPVIVAELMVFLASDILEQELKRRRREAGAVGPRDRQQLRKPA